MPQFCMLFYAKYTILATQRGGHGPMAPPKYAHVPRTWGFEAKELTLEANTKAKDVLEDNTSANDAPKKVPNN